jgi:hypothetical protein
VSRVPRYPSDLTDEQWVLVEPLLPCGAKQRMLSLSWAFHRATKMFPCPHDCPDRNSRARPPLYDRYPITDTKVARRTSRCAANSQSSSERATPHLERVADHHDGHKHTLPRQECKSTTCHRFRTRAAGPTDHTLQSPATSSPTILAARWSLVCPGTARHATVQPGTGIGEVADEPA